MIEKKNIDRLFQEKFKNFEVTPDESAWEYIKDFQQKKKKKPALLPFWYKVAGSAAMLALLVGLGFYFLNTSSPQQHQLVVKDEIDKAPLKNNKEFKDQNDTNVVLSEKNLPSSHTPKNANPSFKQIKINQQIVHTTIKKQHSLNNRKSLTSKKQVGSGNSSQNKTDLATNLKNEEKPSNSSKEVLSNIAAINAFTSDPEKSSVVSDQAKDNVLVFEDSISNDKNLEEKASLLEVIADSKKNKSTLEKSRKWSIAPTIAPVYYNTLSQGSGIDSQFVDNTKQGQVNMSYGVQVAYAVSPKLKIRSGVNRVDLSYGTEKVGFSAFSKGPTLANVAYNDRSDAILINDFENTSAAPAGSEVQSDQKAFIIQNEGILYQELGYLEVPMEISYHLVDKKFGIEVIGGMSTLFLQDNSLSINAGDFTTNIGQATNVNTVSFTGNIGLGFGYQVSKRISANVQPLFKYQVNAFENSSGDFNPFFFGIYSGITIKL